MSSSYNQIHRLKSQANWTWEHLFKEISLIYMPGLDDKTLYSHYRYPHHGGKRHTTKIIDQLHQKYFPDPFPADINGIMRLYNNLQQCSKHKNQSEDIQALEIFAQAQVVRERDSDHLRRCRWLWLLANIEFDRIPDFRDNAKHEQLISTRNAAVRLYEKAAFELEQHNLNDSAQNIEERILFKLRQNALACFLNTVPQNKRDKDPEILTYLQNSNFIDHSKAILKAEPFNWVIARNGLRFSSLLQDSDNCKTFFNILTSASKYFIDLTYKPLDYLSISTGKDFSWAIEHILTPQYLEELQCSLTIKKTE